MSLSQDFNHNNNNNKEIAQKGDDAGFLPQFPQMWRYCNWQLSMVSIFIYSEVYQATRIHRNLLEKFTSHRVSCAEAAACGMVRSQKRAQRSFFYCMVEMKTAP